MFSFSKIKKEDINKFSPKTRGLFKELIPLLKKIDLAKINKSKSKIQTKGIKRSRSINLLDFHPPWEFKIIITPKNKEIAPLGIAGSAWENIFITAGGYKEVLENISRKKFLLRLKDYLDSILVIKSYDKNYRLLKKVYFFGFKGKLMRKRNASRVRCYNPSTLETPVYSTKRIIFSFTKDLSKRDINYNKKRQGIIKQVVSK